MATRGPKKRVNCYAALKKCGLLKNLKQVATGYRQIGMPGLAEVVEGLHRDAKPGMGYFEFKEFYEQAHWVCGMAIFALADMGLPAWIKRREAHLKKMAAERPTDDETAGAEWDAQIAAIRSKMRFADGSPKVKMPRTGGARRSRRAATPTKRK
jgi:hypothetical protein